MADAPWRCSQCGTINEPSANACRRCGRWPSLFDLENGAVEPGAEADEDYTDGQAPFPEEEPSFAGDARSAEEPTTAEPGPLRTEAGADGGATPADREDRSASWPGPEPSIPRTPGGTSMRRLTRLLIPVLVIVYVLIRALTNH